MSNSDKLIHLINRNCLERSRQVEQGLFQNHREVIEEKKHYNPGSAERGYFKVGYLQALRDLRELMRTGEFSSSLDSDGGPKTPGNRRDDGTEATLPSV